MCLNFTIYKPKRGDDMVTTVLVVVLIVLVISAILDAWPSRNITTAVSIVLIAVLIAWLIGGFGYGRTL